MKQTPDGGYIAYGTTYSSGPGKGDFYLIKTDADGNELWNKVFGGPAIEEGQYVENTPDGGYIVVGDQQSYSQGDFDVNVRKFNVDGEEVWNKLLGGNRKDVPKMIINNNGEYLVAAVTRSFDLREPDFWILKLNQNGDITWSKNYGGSFHEHCYVVRPLGDGGFIAVGHTDSPPSAGIDLYVVRADASGSAPMDVKNKNLTRLNIFPNPLTGNIMQLNLGKAIICKCAGLQQNL